MLAPKYLLCFIQDQLLLPFGKAWELLGTGRSPACPWRWPLQLSHQNKTGRSTLSASLRAFPISTQKINLRGSCDAQDTKVLEEGFDCLMSQLFGTETTTVLWQLCTSTVPNPLLSSRQNCCIFSPPVCYIRALPTAGCRGCRGVSTTFSCPAHSEIGQSRLSASRILHHKTKPARDPSS